MMRPAAKVRIGEGAPPRDVGPITQTDIVRFAGAGGDFNPLHHDPEFARSAGFPGVIAMGQMHAGILASWLSDWVGVEYLWEYEVRFLAPVRIDDVLRLAGEVTEIERQETRTVAAIELTATCGATTVARAKARAVVVVD